MNRLPISRRSLLLSSAAAVACGRRKAAGYRGYCFVANQEGRSLAVVNLQNFRVIKRISLDAPPSAVLAHPTRPKVFVLAPEPATIFEIDAATLAVTRKTRIGNVAPAMHLSPTRNALWILSRDPASLVELPLDSLQPNRRIPLPSTPDNFDLKENRAAVSLLENRTILLASLTSASVERILDPGTDPALVRFQSDGRQLLVGSRAERSLTILNVATGKIVVRLPLPLEPRQFCFSADGGQLFINGEGMDAVVIVYPYRTEVAETMLAGRAPEGMAVTKTPPYLLVTNPQTDTVTVLDYDNMGRKLVAIVQVGQGPRHIVMTPSEDSTGTPLDQFALVLNETSGDVAVIRVLALAVNPDGSPRRYHTAPLFTLIPVGAKPVAAAIVALG